jgi:16S rRNA (cytosine967-C5)-methyltransferase
VLIYATCSLEPEEGENIAQQAAGFGLKTLPVAPDELVAGIQPMGEGWVRVLPGQGRDGFFIARFTTA